MTGSGVRVAAKAGQGGAGTDDEPILDEDHLRRMTLGDRLLEREVLQIFVRQAAIMLGRMNAAEPQMAAAAAHSLSGSARGIGAWRVARAADRLERAANERGEELSRAIAELKAASLEASAAIHARSGDPPHESVYRLS